MNRVNDTKETASNPEEIKEMLKILSEIEIQINKNEKDVEDLQDKISKKA